MTERLSLEIISTVDLHGYALDILADRHIKNLYVEVEQLRRIVNDWCEKITHNFIPASPDYFKESFRNVYPASVHVDGDVGNIEVISFADVKYFRDTRCWSAANPREMIPDDFLNISQQEYPAPLNKIEPPKLIFKTLIDGYDFCIWRSENHNLVNLNDLNKALEVGPDFAYTFAACDEDIFFDGDDYFILLASLEDFLYNFNRRAYHLSHNLADDFKAQLDANVFMELPSYGIHIDISAEKFYPEILTPLGNFEIYKGIGFAENAFYANVYNLEDLLNVDSEAFCNTLDEVGYVVSNDKFFCRLDDTAKLVHKYLSRIWNGHNEGNKHIRRGWDFIDWFKNFYDDFINENVQYRAWSHDIYYFYPEESE